MNTKNITSKIIIVISTFGFGGVSNVALAADAQPGLILGWSQYEADNDAKQCLINNPIMGCIYLKDGMHQSSPTTPVEDEKSTQDTTDQK